MELAELLSQMQLLVGAFKMMPAIPLEGITELIFAEKVHTAAYEPLGNSDSTISKNTLLIPSSTMPPHLKKHRATKSGNLIEKTRTNLFFTNSPSAKNDKNPVSLNFRNRNHTPSKDSVFRGK